MVKRKAWPPPPATAAPPERPPTTESLAVGATTMVPRKETSWKSIATGGRAGAGAAREHVAAVGEDLALDADATPAGLAAGRDRDHATGAGPRQGAAAADVDGPGARDGDVARLGLGAEGAALAAGGAALAAGGVDRAGDGNREGLRAVVFADAHGARRSAGHPATGGRGGGEAGPSIHDASQVNRPLRIDAQGGGGPALGLGAQAGGRTTPQPDEAGEDQSPLAFRVTSPALPPTTAPAPRALPPKASIPPRIAIVSLARMTMAPAAPAVVPLSPPELARRPRITTRWASMVMGPPA